MNELTQEGKQKTWKLRYVRWLRLGNWLLIPIYLFVVLIPLYYEATAEIPPVNQLHVAEGALTHEWLGRRGELTGLKTAEGEIYFTCRLGSFAKNHGCLRNFNETKELAGKQATIWWFKQTILPFSDQRRLVRLVVDGEEKIGLEKSRERTRWGANRAPWYLAGLLIFFIGLAVFSEKTARRIEHGQANS